MTPRPRVPRVRRSSLILAFAVAALAFPLGVLATHQFADVPTNASFHDDVQALVEAGVTSGCGGGNYCPSNNVTRGQMAQFLNRLGNLDGNSSPSVDADKLDGLDSTDFVQTLSAVVNADGTVDRGKGVTSVTHTAAAGSYIVHFDRNVRACAYTASIGLSGASGTSARGFITVVGAAADSNGVFVTTDDIAGAPAERGFHLVVTCDGFGATSVTSATEFAPPQPGALDNSAR
jgi:hypothetical protein